MRAMIMAAGRGERLRPLTDTLPKALVEAGNSSLLERHLTRLARAGFKQCVINLGHLGEQIKARVGDGSRWNIRIHWSDEQPEALETGGGIHKALPLLGTSPFLVVNGDVWTDFPFARLRAVKCDWAHLVMIPNPPQHPSGDFTLLDSRIRVSGEPKLTFSGIGVYHPRLFKPCTPGKFSVVPLLRSAMENHLVTGEKYAGCWEDIGTLERLRLIRS